jgi:hypothetical protein
MQEDNNNMPTMRTPEEIRWDTLRPYLLDPRQNYPEPYHILEFNEVGFGKIGGFGAISGQRKNGKTFLIAQLMAAILGCDGNERTKQYLPGLRVPDRTLEFLGHPPKVMYVDTEMEKLSSAKVLRRVHWLCNQDMSQPFPGDLFSVLWLKNMPSNDGVAVHRKRYDLIRLAVDAIQPDVIFIDGLRDLLSSINDEESITKILNDFGSLAEERNINIWMALHQNPSKKEDAEDLKMRGWAGTEYGNKVSDTLVSIKNKTANGVSFVVKQQDARDKDMDDWKFEITDDAGQLGVPRIITTGSNLNSKNKEQPMYDDPKLIREWIDAAKDQYEWPMDRKTIKATVFGEIGGVKNKDKQQADLNVAINMHYLEESTIKKNGYPMLQPAEDMPF